MIFVTISIVYYEVVIQTIYVKKPILNELNSLHHALVVSDDEKEIHKMIKRANLIYSYVEGDAETLYAVFLIIEILCILNLSFFLQNLIEFIFTRRMGRFYQFPTIAQITDIALCASSSVIIDWFQNHV